MIKECFIVVMYLFFMAMGMFCWVYTGFIAKVNRFSMQSMAVTLILIMIAVSVTWLKARRALYLVRKRMKEHQELMVQAAIKHNHICEHGMYTDQMQCPYCIMKKASLLKE